MANLYGEDRDSAIAAMDDDTAFDKWLRDFENKRRAEMRDSAMDKGKEKVRISQEEYIRRFAKHH